MIPFKFKRRRDIGSALLLTSGLVWKDHGVHSRFSKTCSTLKVLWYSLRQLDGRYLSAHYASTLEILLKRSNSSCVSAIVTNYIALVILTREDMYMNRVTELTP
jgi:hypothetical protein